MNVTCHILAFNEAEILPYTLRHYGQFCNRIVLHDGFSTDGSRELAREFGAEVVDMHSDGVNDTKFKTLKETCWRGTDADWVITPDADELIYFPEGPMSTLGSYEAAGEAVIKPHGFEMFSDEMPKLDGGQIYDQIRYGAPDDTWYAKAILFSPKRIESIVFSAGSHTCWATLKNGQKISDPQVKTNPPCYLLHYHQIGGLERIARRYNVQQSRHSETNIRNKWGNFKPGMVHAKEKRDSILPRLKEVVPG